MNDISFSDSVEQHSYSDWEAVFENLVSSCDDSGKINPAIINPASLLTPPEQMDMFKSAELRSLNLGAANVYRDTNDQCSIQVRVFTQGTPIPHTNEITYNQDMYHIQLNWHNPNDVSGALKHLIIDVLKLDIPQIEQKC